MLNRVTDAINDIKGVSAKVNLKKNTAKIVCDRETDINVIKEALEEYAKFIAIS